MSVRKEILEIISNVIYAIAFLVSIGGIILGFSIVIN